MKLYRYFYPTIDIFSNITDIELGEPEAYYNYYKNHRMLPKGYDIQYIKRRLETEEIMYKTLLKKGLRLKRKHPHYMTMGKCDEWFFGKKHCFGSIAFDISEFDINTISFTYGDSIPTYMDEYDDGKPYRKNVYTYKEILELVEQYGNPKDWNTFCEYGPENYIEVQIWSNDNPIKLCRTPVFTEEDVFYPFVSYLSGRILCTMMNKCISMKDYEYFITFAKKQKLWGWFKCRLKRVTPLDYQRGIIHGIEHSYKCAFYAYIIGYLAMFHDKEIKTLVLAALYHDIGRKYSESGIPHGQIGADIVGLYIDEKEEVDFGAIVYAILYHEDDVDVEQHKILSYLKDVDSLDYMRLGFGVFDSTRLKSKEAFDLIRLSIELNILMYWKPSLISQLINED